MLIASRAPQARIWAHARRASRVHGGSSPRHLSTFAARLEAFNAEHERQRQQRLRQWESIQAVEVALEGSDQVILVDDPSATPIGVAKATGMRVGKDPAIARVNGELWDLRRPISEAVLGGQRGPISVGLHYVTDDVVRPVFAHSAAHVLGLALEREYGDGLLLADGPPVNDGRDGEFFYDAALPNGKTIHQADLDALTNHARDIAKAALPFDRLEVDRAVAMAIFAYSPLKERFLERLPSDARITLYRLGDLVDLCRGPHLPHSGLVRAVEFTRVAGTNEGEQRVYGVAFPANQMLTEYRTRLAAAMERDHRGIGERQGLFIFHQWAPGAPFFLPHGMRIISRLKEMIQLEYRQMGYAEVGSPSVYSRALWQTSGHWDVYKDDMFVVRGGGEGPEEAAREAEYGLKPMNCPGHCVMFAHGVYSYRDLPIRFADFGALHRNEKSGALSGLTRVRKFHQDDAHIFCRPDQIADEVSACLAMVERVYGRFGMPVTCALSTRPDEFIGSEAVWAAAERSLAECLERTGRPYTIHAGDGAFYGPKIDVTVTDALGREHQTATVQLDFNLPQRFGLKYMDEGGMAATPVMVHRAVLGSLERLLALLCEHTAGKWPAWLSPRHVLVVPVATAGPQVDYANQVAAALHASGFHVDTDARRESLGRRVRAGWALQYNYVLVVGDKELSTGAVSVRPRGANDGPSVPLESFIADLTAECAIPDL